MHPLIARNYALVLLNLQNWLSERLAVVIHTLNLAGVLIVPAAVILVIHPNPGELNVSQIQVSHFCPPKKQLTNWSKKCSSSR